MPPLALPRARQPRSAGGRGRGGAVLRARAGARPGVRAGGRQRDRGRRRSAGASTGCRWRSSWRLPAAGCCRRPRSRDAWTPPSVCWARARATRPRASRRCARRSIGATSCSATTSGRCFARFAVFAGGATVDAAEAITGASLDTLDLLVAKSLLVRRRQPDAADPARDARDDPRLCQRAVRGDAGPRRRARAPRPLLPRAGRARRERARAVGDGRKEHLARLDADIDNLHSALGWAVAQTTPNQRSHARGARQRTG